MIWFLTITLISSFMPSTTATLVFLLFHYHRESCLQDFWTSHNDLHFSSSLLRYQCHRLGSLEAALEAGLELEIGLIVVIVQLLSPVLLFATLWTAAFQASLSFTFSQSLFKFTSIELVIIKPSHPLSSPSPAFNLSQHQGLIQWIGSPHQVAKVLELQLQYQSFQWIFRMDFL